MTNPNRSTSGIWPFVGLERDLPLLGYSAGNFGKNLLLASVDVTLVFMLTDLLGVAPTSVSILMLLVLAGDLVFDLGAGLLASWSQSIGVGYRRLIVLGAVPCGAAFALLYSLPALGERRFGALAATLLIFRAAYAIIDVPHNSLLVRVAADSRARGRTSGYRIIFSSLASLGIAVLLAPSVQNAAGGAGPGMLATLGVSGGLLFCLALGLAAWSSRNAAGPSAGRKPRASRVTLLPKLDRLLAGIAVVAFVTGFATPMFSRMVLYLSTYVFGHPAFASHILIAIILGQFLGALLWIHLVRFREKTTLLAVSHAVAAGGFLLFALVGARPEPLIAVSVLIGVGLAGVFMLPWGILADVVDFAEFRHRERRETATFALVLVIIKAGGAASAGVIGWTLGQLGYTPGAHQAWAVLVGMKALACGVPIIGGLVAILVLSRLSIGHLAHARILRALGARRLRADQGSSGSMGSIRSEDAAGRKVSSTGESLFSTLPG
jgi:GPH family glycoside/pentoside/hexuronide:cation symporter